LPQPVRSSSSAVDGYVLRPRTFTALTLRSHSASIEELAGVGGSSCIWSQLKATLDQAHREVAGLHGLQLYQLTAAGQHNLRHVLKTTLDFTERLLGVAIGAFLHHGGLIASPLDQIFTLLLGLLTELQGIVTKTLCLCLSLLLQAKPLLSDLLKLCLRLLAGPFMLITDLTLGLTVFLLKLLASLQSLLFKLLATGCHLLLHLSEAALKILFRLGRLLTCGLKQLLAMLSRLLTHFSYLLLSLLAD